MQSVRILLVEDDPATRNLLENNLIAQAYNVDVAMDGQSAIDLTQHIDYDLVILDVEIPKIDGISVCKHLRTKNYQMPILLLTGHDLTSDRVIGLDAGADDYMIKPFNLLELLARIRALLRRSSVNTSSLIIWGELQLDRTLKEISHGDCLLRLTPKEYGILELLLLNPQRILSRSDFLDRLWELEEPPTESTISSHIKALRQKLKAAGATQNFIETIYGFGYRLRYLEGKTPINLEKPLDKAPEHIPEKSLEQVPQNPGLDAIETMMLGLWERFKDSFQEQLAFLEQVIDISQPEQLLPELQQEAKQTVHKLVGSLGIFGFPQGSVLAKKMESLLATEPPLSRTTLQEMQELMTALRQELRQEPVFYTSEPKSPDHRSPHEQLSREPDVSLDTINPLAAMPQANPQFSLVLVVDDDQFLAESLQIEAHRQFAHGAMLPTLRIEIAPNPSAAQLAISRCEANAQQLPDLILLDLTFAEGKEDGWQWLASLKQQYPQIPVLVFTGRDSLSDRVMAVRLGAQAFLQKPITHAEVFQAIQANLKQTHPLEVPIAGKVMAVDDDPMMLHQLSILLSAWGLQVKPLLEPSRFWEVLTKTAPDILLLDIEMPGFNGIELCQVVRNDPQWEHLPILFLTAHQDPAMMIQAFASGGNDYIRKPLQPPELIARVLRLLDPEQGRQQQLMLTLMEQTKTTGISHLEVVADASRQQKPSES